TSAGGTPPRRGRPAPVEGPPTIGGRSRSSPGVGRGPRPSLARIPPLRGTKRHGPSEWRGLPIFKEGPGTFARPSPTHPDVPACLRRRGNMAYDDLMEFAGQRYLGMLVGG